MVWPWVMIFVAYLIGGIPVGVLVARARGVNLREIGSGNIGATNVSRALGTKVGLLVGLTDVLKGLLPVIWARPLLVGLPLDTPWPYLGGVGFAAVLGHCFPVYLGFRGGRGVATALGAILGLDWRVGLLALAVWVFVLLITRYVSLSSVLGAVSVPLFFQWLPLEERWADVRPSWVAFGIAVALLILVRHLPNLARLIQGKEHQVGQKMEGPRAEGVESGAETDTEYR